MCSHPSTTIKLGAVSAPPLQCQPYDSRNLPALVCFLPVTPRCRTAVPEALEAESLVPVQTRRAADGMTIMTASLAPAALLLPDPKVAALVHDTEHRIYAIVGDGHNARASRRSWRYRVRGLRMWAELPVQTPNIVADAAPTAKLLQVRLQSPLCKVPQTAIVRTNRNACAFSVEAARGRHLNVDLGHLCKVTHHTTPHHPPRPTTTATLCHHHPLPLPTPTRCHHHPFLISLPLSPPPSPTRARYAPYRHRVGILRHASTHTPRRKCVTGGRREPDQLEAALKRT